MTLRIQFHPSVDPPPELIPFPASALRELLRTEGLADEGEVNCVLADDAALEDLNRRFRNRSGPTDVLAFPYDPAVSDGVHGDVYVSLDRARAQAAERREPLEREIWRLFVHGALHLAGRDHDSDEAERAMLAVQEECVERVFPGGASTASGP
ncbi:MAG TPA: rRNA maturation RNase YbeY [Gemmatimonadota bacterium]|nr:rRNA maturation RNase YbeY [Gemmatimonadota bacterium]